MAVPNLIIQDDDHQRLSSLLDQLRRDSNARLTFLLDKNGQQLARSGEMDAIDPTALASLVAGNVAATEGLAQLIGEEQFAAQFHEGHSESLHINVVCDRTVLLVLFDERSSLGLVRLRVQQVTSELAGIVQALEARSRDRQVTAQESVSPLMEITDEDIDALFG